MSFLIHICSIKNLDDTESIPRPILGVHLLFIKKKSVVVYFPVNLSSFDRKRTARA